MTQTLTDAMKVTLNIIRDADGATAEEVAQSRYVRWYQSARNACMSEVMRQLSAMAECGAVRIVGDPGSDSAVYYDASNVSEYEDRLLDTVSDRRKLGDFLARWVFDMSGRGRFPVALYQLLFRDIANSLGTPGIEAAAAILEENDPHGRHRGVVGIILQNCRRISSIRDRAIADKNLKLQELTGGIQGETPDESFEYGPDVVGPGDNTPDGGTQENGESEVVHEP